MSTLQVLLHEGGTLLVCLNSVRALNPPTWSWREDISQIIDRMRSLVMFLRHGTLPSTIQAAHLWLLTCPLAAHLPVATEWIVSSCRTKRGFKMWRTLHLACWIASSSRSSGWGLKPNSVMCIFLSHVSGLNFPWYKLGCIEILL